MAKNDIVLLDSLVEKAKPGYGSNLNDGDYFELFCFDQILKDSDPSFEEIEQGWVDGGNDGGIDGFYTVLDGKAVVEEPDVTLVRKNPNLELVIFTVKHSDGFKQGPLNSLFGTILSILDLTIKRENIEQQFNEQLLDCRELFQKTFVSLAPKMPNLKIRIKYCSRGDKIELSPNIIERAKQLEGEVKKLFSDAEAFVDFVDAADLLQIARKERTYSLKLPFIEGNISRAKTNYIILSKLPDYYKFVTDEDGVLRRYLFESNVRDYLGEVPVNNDINETLENARGNDGGDFWWLNNGVTILASGATIVGKEIFLENVQIVNGLQTTETIFNFFDKSKNFNDERALLIKILVSDNQELRDRIIKATNYQNSVELSLLRSTDITQRNIEQFLADHDWFYDRRKGFYKNQGKPAERIVSVSYVGAAIRALVLKDIGSAANLRTRWMRKDETYHEVFNLGWDLNIYLTAVQIVKQVEAYFEKRGYGLNANGTRSVRRRKYSLSLLLASGKLKSIDFSHSDLVSLKGIVFNEEDLSKAFNFLDIISKMYGKDRRSGKSPLFNYALDYLSQNKFEFPENIDEESLKGVFNFTKKATSQKDPPGPPWWKTIFKRKN